MQEGLPYLLVLPAGDLLKEIWDALPLRNVKAEALEEGKAVCARPVVEDVTCKVSQVCTPTSDKLLQCEIMEMTMMAKADE